MYLLPAATTLANDAVRRQFAATAPALPGRRHARPPALRARLALAATLERAAHAIAPARYRAAH